MSTVERDHVVAPAVVTERDVLHRAADLLEEFGWRQCALGSKESGGFCMLGAFLAANRDFGRNEEDGIYEAGDLVWKDLLPRNGGLFPVGWNNAPGRTKAEVVARLREAAEASA